MFSFSLACVTREFNETSRLLYLQLTAVGIKLIKSVQNTVLVTWRAASLKKWKTGNYRQGGIPQTRDIRRYSLHSRKRTMHLRKIQRGEKEVKLVISILGNTATECSHNPTTRYFVTFFHRVARVLSRARLALDVEESIILMRFYRHRSMNCSKNLSGSA